MNLLKGAHMNLFNRTITTLAAVFALTPVVAAQAQQVDLIARVPFEFTVGDASLPRAAYQLSRLNGHPEMLLVRSERKGVFIRTEEVRLPRHNAAPSLVFHRYGDQYFLREIRLDGKARLDVPETQAERDAAEGRTDRATPMMETVIVPADRQ
jgi:hypothetical protein